jgi:hypothetical protein
MSNNDPRAVAQAALDAHGIEAFIDDILDGLSYADIAQKLGIGKSSVFRWIAIDPARSARTREALTQSAQSEDEKAVAYLTGSDGNKHSDAIRRELAAHCRWRARVRNPKEYGDKLEIDSTSKVINASDSELDAQMQAINKKLAELDAAAKAPLAQTGLRGDESATS